MTIRSRGVNGLGVVDTIYEEDQEELYQSSPEISTSNSSRLESKDSCIPRDRSPWIVFENGEYNSPDRVSDGMTSTQEHEALHRSVCSWYKATGFPTSVTIHIIGCTFELHKFPLVSRSGYFKRELMDSKEIYLNPPGGAKIFELIAAYCYGSTILMGPSTIAAIRCASEFFEMTEEQYKGNLCRRSQLYFQDVILKNWDDAIEALRSCEELHPIARELEIVSACVEALALLACSEIMNEKQRSTSIPLTPMELGFDGGGQMENHDKDWLIDDLLTLPIDYFRQILESIRRQGDYERFIGRALVLYVDRWVYDTIKPHGHKKSKDSEMKNVLECVIRLLPVEKEDTVPVSFLFGLLRCAFAWNVGKECRFRLEIRIAGQLDQARLADFLLPLTKKNDNGDDEETVYDSHRSDSKKRQEEEICVTDTSPEVDSMQHIVSLFMSLQDVGDDSDYSTLYSEGNASSRSSSSSNPSVCNVTKIWDEYLTEIAVYPWLSPAKFMDFVETVPSFSRPAHDQLYKAIHIYLKNHPQTSNAERLDMCKTLNCQKLSQQTCFHAVQNDFMPLRMIVQAMYIHQLQANRTSTPQITRLPPRSSSTRVSTLEKNINNKKPSPHYMPYPLSKSESRKHEDRESSLGSLLKKNSVIGQASNLKSDMEETNSRLRNLEEEMACMRKKINGSFKEKENNSDGVTAEEEFSNKLRENSDLKRLHSVTKGCGGGGIAQKLIKSLQKLSLGGSRRPSNRKRTENQEASGKSKWASDWQARDESPGTPLELDVTSLDQPMRRSRQNHSIPPVSVSSSCSEINVVRDKSMTGRISHERSRSIS